MIHLPAEAAMHWAPANVAQSMYSSHASHNDQRAAIDQTKSQIAKRMQAKGNAQK
jgi:hypothetical protein